MAVPLPPRDVLDEEHSLFGFDEDETAHGSDQSIAGASVEDEADPDPDGDGHADDGDGAAGGGPPEVRRRGRRPRVAGLVLLLLVSPGFWQQQLATPLEAELPGDRKILWGGVLANWYMNEQPSNDNENFWASKAITHCRNVPTYGCVYYSAVEVLKLSRPDGVQLPPDPLNMLPSAVAETVAREPATLNGAQPGLFGELLARLAARTQKPLQVAYFAASLVADVLQRRASIFHAVAITERVDKSRILREPGTTTLTRFRARVREKHVNTRVPSSMVRRVKKPEGFLPVDDIVDWLYASRHLLNPNKADLASFDMARIFTRSPDERAKLRLNRIPWNREVLRKARTRLDITVMLLTRMLWDMFDWQKLSVYLFVDGSPQYRGYELYAATIDILHEEFEFRLLLPLISLAKSLLDQEGKLRFIGL